MEPSELTKQVMGALREDPKYLSALKEIKQCFRPMVPAYRPGQSQEETFSLLERIKFESGRTEGFDLLYLILTGDR